MDLKKSIEFFNPLNLKEEVHIIGVGAVGSYIALTLVKLGIENLYIWDFDTVESHNIVNQVYDATDIGKLKTHALERHLLDNNDKVKIHKKGKYTGQALKGIVYLTVDSIKIRKNTLENLRYNPFIKLIIDGRIGLEKGQVINTVWNDDKLIQNHIDLSSFKESESDAPVSACGSTLSVAPSVIITAQYAVAQLINFVNQQPIKQLIQFDAFLFKTIAC